jgi:hypothetical protein
MFFTKSHHDIHINVNIEDMSNFNINFNIGTRPTSQSKGTNINFNFRIRPTLRCKKGITSISTWNQHQDNTQKNTFRCENGINLLSYTWNWHQHNETQGHLSGYNDGHQHDKPQVM